MRIGLDAKRALNNATGLGNHARILVNALMRDYKDEEYHLFSPSLQEHFLHRLNGTFQLHLPTTKWHKSFPGLWRSRGMVKDLLRERISLYHGLSNELPLGIHHTRIKTVVTIHDLIFLKHKEQYPVWDRLIYEYKTRHAAKYANAIIAVSEETKRDLIHYYHTPANKITVIHPAVEEQFEQASFSSDQWSNVKSYYRLPKKFILHVGSFFPRKNQLGVIKAFNLLKDKIQEDVVLIGGGGTQLSFIRQYITEHALKNRVHILHNVKNEDLPAIYHAATALVFPALYEGFGAPVLEALFSKTPVITTGGGAMEEASGKGALLVNPESAEDIAEKILQVTFNPVLRNQMITTGLTHAQTMSTKVFAEKTMQLYNSL